MRIKKAIIPVAGKGTRFLPATKEVPKELIPILNVPMIQHVVKEAVDSGIEQIVFVTSSGKESIENFFDRNMELEEFLHNSGKLTLAQDMRDIGSQINVSTIRQKEQLGLGHAILMAKNLINEGESFAVLLGDDLTFNKKSPVTKQLIEVSEDNNGSSVIGVMEVPKMETSKYGIVDGQFLNESKKTLKMSKMVEKPEADKAPTNLATPGRYILNSSIFSYLEEIKLGAGGEYQLTDAINLMAKNENVLAHLFDGDRFDTGNVKGYLNATIEMALRDESLKKYTINLLKEKLERYS